MSGGSPNVLLTKNQDDQAAEVCMAFILAGIRFLLVKHEHL